MNTKLQVLEHLETVKIGRISLLYSGFWVTENIVGLIPECVEFILGFCIYLNMEVPFRYFYLMP